MISEDVFLEIVTRSNLLEIQNLCKTLKTFNTWCKQHKGYIINNYIKKHINIRYIQNGYMESPLTVAIKGGDISMVNKLLDLGANVDKMLDLHLNTISRMSPTVVNRIEDLFVLNEQFKNAVENHNVQLAIELLKRGANPNVQYEMDDTPLMFACDIGNLDFIKLLVNKYGANVNASNSFGYSVLDTLELLVTQSKLGVRPVLDNIKQFLISKGAKSSKLDQEFDNQYNHLGYKRNNPEAKRVFSILLGSDYDS